MDRLTGDFKGASMFATAEQARQYNRLRQYEDTGLTPEEIAALRAELDALKADIEAGRLVRLPCKPGDTLYAVIPEQDEHGGDYISPWKCTGVIVYEDGSFGTIDGDNMVDKIGTQYAYLTEEAARAALEGETP